MREKKKESRCKLSRQKNAILRTKQNNQRQKARTTARNNTDDDQNHCTADITSPMSRATIYRKTSAVRSNIPKFPKSFATVISTLISTATPRKQTEMEKRGVKRKTRDDFVIPSLKKTMKRLKTGINEEKRRHYNVIASAALQTERYGIKGKLAASLGIGHHICRKMTKKAGDAALPRKKEARCHR